MLNIELGARNSTSSFSAKKSRRNRFILRCDLNVLMLPELQMTSGSLFRTAGAAEKKRSAAALVRDFDTVSKSISPDLSPQHGTYGFSVACR